MQDLLEKQLEEGSIGISCGLEYAPGAYATNEELVELLNIVSKHNKLFAIHMRNEDDRVEQAVSEAISMARAAGARLQISHLKAQNFDNWHKGPALIRLIENARSEGLDVAFDRYPYIAFSTGLTSFIPLDGRQGSTDDVLSRLQDKETAQAFGVYARSRFARFGGPQNVYFACLPPHNKSLYGTYRRRMRPSLVNRNGICKGPAGEERLQSSMVVFAMTEDNVRLSRHTPGMLPPTAVSTLGPLSKPFPILFLWYFSGSWENTREETDGFAEAVKNHIPAGLPPRT